MSEEALREFGLKSELFADLYALKQHLHESNLEPKTYYLEGVEGGFVRPSFYLKFVSYRTVPYNQYMSILEQNVQVQFFTEDYFDAIYTSEALMNLLAPPSDLILPKYDFTTSPPTKLSVTGRDSAGNEVGPIAMGIRIDRTTVNSTPFQEEDETWNVPVSFTMRSPLISSMKNTPLRHIKVNRIGPPPEYSTQVGKIGTVAKLNIERTDS
jgi:hypothetical protein